MRSHHHLLLSVVLGVVLSVTVVTGLPPVAVVLYAAVLGVFVDLDHFPVARLNVGDWRTLRRGLWNPRLLLTDQSDLIEPGEVGGYQRLVSHLLLAGLLVAALYAVGLQALGFVTALVLYLHVLADVAWEAWRWGAEEDAHRRRESETPDDETVRAGASGDRRERPASDADEGREETAETAARTGSDDGRTEVATER